MSLALLSCSGSASHTSDAYLISIFQNKKQAFDGLVELSKNQSLDEPHAQKHLADIGAKSMTSSSDSIKIPYSFVGFGLDGSVKGFAYLPTAPKQLEQSLDGSNPAPETKGIWYRKLAGHWYLYLQNHN